MPKFKVRAQETTSSYIVVDAKDAEQAEHIASSSDSDDWQLDPTDYTDWHIEDAVEI